MRAAREKIMHPAIRKSSPVLASARKKSPSPSLHCDIVFGPAEDRAAAPLEIPDHFGGDVLRCEVDPFKLGDAWPTARVLLAMSHQAFEDSVDRFVVVCHDSTVRLTQVPEDASARLEVCWTGLAISTACQQQAMGSPKWLMVGAGRRQCPP